MQVRISLKNFDKKIYYISFTDQGLLIGNSLASESGSGTLKIENSGTYDGQLVFSDSDGAKWVSGNQVHAEEVKLSVTRSYFRMRGNMVQ